MTDSLFVLKNEKIMKRNTKVMADSLFCTTYTIGFVTRVTLPFSTQNGTLKKNTTMSTNDEHIDILPTLNDAGRETVEDLILQNKTLDALIKGLMADLETFKKYNEGAGSPQDTVRFTMQLNIMKDKKNRNLAAINEIIKQHKEDTSL